MQVGGFKLLNLKTAKAGSNAELADSYNAIQKTVFILAFASGAEGTLDIRLRKICEAFNADTFSIQHSSISNDLRQTQGLIEAQNRTVAICEESINEYFDFYQQPIVLQRSPTEQIEICSYIEYIRLLLHKERTVQLHLNYLVKNGENFVKGLLWIPEENEAEVVDKLHDIAVRRANSMQAA